MTNDPSSSTARNDLGIGDERQLRKGTVGVRPEQLAAAARVMAHVMSRPARTPASISTQSPLWGASRPDGGSHQAQPAS